MWAQLWDLLLLLVSLRETRVKARLASLVLYPFLLYYHRKWSLFTSNDGCCFVFQENKWRDKKVDIVIIKLEEKKLIMRRDWMMHN